jgi:hypothetical protein
MRYVIDEHVATFVATGLRRRGVGVTTVAEAGLLGAEDADLLAWVSTVEEMRGRVEYI